MAAVLVDTSAWILAVNRRDPRAKARIAEVVAAGTAATCPLILLEMLIGRSRGDAPEVVRRRFSPLLWLECTDAVWERAYAVASEARSRGHTLPAADSLIAAHALVEDAVLLHADADYVRIASWSGLVQESLL